MDVLHSATTSILTGEAPQQEQIIPQHDLVTVKHTVLSSHLLRILVSIHPSLLDELKLLTTKIFEDKNLEGFHKRQAPLDYLKETFKNEISTKVKNYLFNHLVLRALVDYIAKHKLISCNYPRLVKVGMPAEGPWTFEFDISVTAPIELKEWKNFSFKSPKRKKYKDLDKQVINFIEAEQAEIKKSKQSVVEEGDWVAFDTRLVDLSNNPLEKFGRSVYWMKIKQHAGIDTFRDIFIGKSSQETFISDHVDVDHQPNDYENYRHRYLVTVLGLIKGSHLSLDLLRSTFKLKNKADIHNKLMEVFSFRNDESQRRSIIEEMFHLLLSKHRFEVPKHLVLRRQEDLHLVIQKQPDYQVYKAQKDFESHLEQLAEKQLKEEILIDQITYEDGIVASLDDAMHYLHLYGNRRMREFVYFRPTLLRLDDINIPLNAVLLQQTVTREKTLNHIIHAMTH